MPVHNEMKALYAKLAGFGFPRAYVRKNLLPSWWDDEAANTNAGFAEALLHIARTSGVDVASLRSSDVTNLRATASVRFKKRGNADTSELEVARALATQLARTVASASLPSRPVPCSALDLREQLLDARPWVDLETLVSYCWSVGIPVIRTTNFPTGTKKPDALVVDLSGRRVIVLTSGRTSAPWLLFYVAHELGHIACGHLSENSELVDADVNRDDADEEEVEANNWAVTLLSGKPDVAFRATSSWPNADGLATSARSLGRKLETDPGFVVLNYAYSMGSSFFAVANAALGKMPGMKGGDEVVRRLAQAKLDWSRLGEDASEFASRMMGTADEDVAVPAP